MRAGEASDGPVPRQSRLVYPPFLAQCRPVEKKSLRRLHAAADKLKALPHLDEAERLLFARSLLATPDERWMFSHRYVQLVNSLRLSMPKKSAS